MYRTGSVTVPGETPGEWARFCDHRVSSTMFVNARHKLRGNVWRKSDCAVHNSRSTVRQSFAIAPQHVQTPLITPQMILTFAVCRRGNYRSNSTTIMSVSPATSVITARESFLKNCASPASSSLLPPHSSNVFPVEPRGLALLPPHTHHVRMCFLSNRAG